MVVALIGVARRESPLSGLADSILRISHRWPRIEIIMDGKRITPSSFAEAEGRYCIVVLHAGDDVVNLEREGARLMLTPASCLGLSELSGSPFQLRAYVGEDVLRVVTDKVGSIPMVFITGPLGAFAGSWNGLLRDVPGEAHEIPPSSELAYSTISGGGVNGIRSGDDRPSTLNDIDAKAAELAELIELSVSRNVARRCGVLFSGGLDSSVLLRAIMNKGMKPLTITIGLKGSHDLEAAKEAASEIGGDSIFVETNPEDVRRAVVYVKRALGYESPLDLSMASLIFMAADKLSSMGYRQLVAGQGADELFGGYMKYQLAISQGGVERALEGMVRDVSNFWSTSVRRDYAAAALGGCLLTLPYIDPALFSYASSLAPNDKVSTSERKIVLRRAARLLGLPERVADRPKKAAQYGSRIERVVKKFLMENKLKSRV